MDWSVLIDVWALVGIALEIWGFVWLLSWSSPNKEACTRWFNGNRKHDPTKDDLWIDKETQIDHIFGLSTQVYNWEDKDAHAFVDFVNKRKEWAIKLVIMGLAGQIMQIIHENIAGFSSM